jgi:hypothetical protein
MRRSESKGLPWSAVRRSLSRFAPARRPESRRRLALEHLEDRTLLSPAGASNSQILQAYGQIPLIFQVNEGQTAAEVNFLSQGSGYTMFLTPTEAVLNLQKAAPAVGGGASLAATAKVADLAKVADWVVLTSSFVGANPQPQVVGLDRLLGTSNYFIGNDPSQWHTNVANYGQVEYQNLYPGVDLVYFGNQRQLEYNYVVSPGANPGVIKLAIKGAESMTIDGQGNLVLHTAGGDVVEDAPVVYQEKGGVRQTVSGQFALEGGGQVGFALGAYDHTRPLVIDPVLSYSTFLGADDGSGIAVDSAGNAYVTGETSSTGFPTTPGVFQTTNGGGYADAFVIKLDSTGTALVYSTYLGGTGFDYGTSIAVDTAGSAYVTGATSSTDFPTTPDAYQTIHGGEKWDAFVTKLNPTGTALVYSTYLNGWYGADALGIAVDTGGNAYVTGCIEPLFPAAAFVTKLNATGTALVYYTYLGGTTGGAVGYGIALDTAGNAYVTGYTTSKDFPTTPGAFQPTFGGGNNFHAFVTKLNATGTVVYSTYLGGSVSDQGAGIAVDTAGDAYVTGATTSTDFPTTAGAYQTTFGGGAFDAFVTKLNPTGTALVYSTYLGGTEADDDGTGIAVDSAGNAYVTGYTGSTDFPTTAGAFQTTFGGGSYDAFLTKLNPKGSGLAYSTYLGGTGYDQGYGIAVDSAGNAYVTGITESTDFPTTAGAIQTTFGGGTDAFVAKFALGPINVLTVNTLADDPSSPIPGYTTLRDAITEADAGPLNKYVISFAVTGTIDVISSLPDLSNHIDIDGPGASNLTVQRDPYAAPFSVFTVDSGVTANFSGLTIAGGNAGSGGGILSYGTTTVSDSTITSNSAGYYGGGIFSYGTLSISGSTISNNSAARGGGIRAEQGTLSISGSTISNNSAGEGGGISNGYGTTTISDSTITSNSAGGQGGGVLNVYGTTTVSGSTISNNSAGQGGGIENGGTTTVSDSTITSNSAGGIGGGVFNAYGTTSISGSTITSNSAYEGGGILSVGTTTVSDSTITSNSAYEGGGIYVYSYGTVTLTDVTLANDSAQSYGGGLYNDGYATLTVSESVFSGNSASSATYGFGGGVYNAKYATLTLIDSSFTNNSAGPEGGGVFNFGTLTVSDSVFSRNSTKYDGGGICNDGTGTVIGSSFSNNTAKSGGGLWNFGTATVTDSTFTNNSANNSDPSAPVNDISTGGGLCVNSGTVTVTDSVFVGNSAGGGGGLYSNGAVTVIDSTFSDNSATNALAGGGGLWNIYGTATVINCTVSGNFAAYGGGIAGVGGVVSMTLNNTIVAGNSAPTHSDVDGAYTGSKNLIGGNPLLAPLANYGGPTPTMALLPGSPAIGAGSVVLAVDANGNPLTTDQRGLHRVVNQTVDIGAFESQGFTLTPVAGITPQVTPANLPFANPLAVTVTANNPLEPVAGGTVTFSAPASGASAILSSTSPVTIGSDGQASVTATANAIGGSYTVTAATSGATAPVSFAVTNQFLGQTISFGPLADQTYGVAPITLSAKATSGLPVSFSLISGPATLSGSVLKITGAGTVEVEASQAGNASYAAAVPVDESFTVAPDLLTIKPTAGQSKLYGGALPALLTYTASGFVNGDPTSLLTGALGTTATATSMVGKYPFTLGSLTAGPNYALTLAANSPTFAVTPATVYVTANPETKVYGSPDPVLTYAVSGLQVGDAAASVLSGALTRTVGEMVAGGPYAISRGTLAADANYTLAFTGNILTITQATPTITWVNPSAITYGTVLSTTQLDATASWKVGGKTVNVPGRFVYNPAAGTILGAGNNQALSTSFMPTDISDYTNAKATASLNVNQHASSVSLVAASTAGAPGQTITFTATVAGGLPSPCLPTGSVQFQANGVNVGSPVPLTAKDAAAFAMTEPASGSFSVTAIYSGDVNFTTSRSAACTESVLSPGVYAVGSTLYVVGSSSNDYAMISPSGGRLDGSTGLAVIAMLNGASVTKAFKQSFTAIDIFGYVGNDNFQLFPTLTLPTTVVEGNGSNYIQLAGGNDTVTLGSGSNQVFGGNGNKSITASDIAGTRGYFSLGNGNDIVRLGDGSDVVVEGNGNDYVSAGNGSDLIVAGLGQHSIQLGNGNDILIDGSATVVNFGDSLRQVLSDWNANPLTSVNKRLKVVNNTSHPNVLRAGSALDWWFYTNSKDVTNKKATDRLN